MARRCRGRPLAVAANVSQFARILLGLGIASVSLLQQTHACWAAETTQQGIAGSVFAGTGEMIDSNNEDGGDAYDVNRLGFGWLGVLRFEGRPEAAAPSLPEPSETEAVPAPERNLGAFVQAGIVAELEWTRLTYCGDFCRWAPGGEEVVTPGPSRQAPKVGLRAGGGYSFSLVEFRVGLLRVMPGSDSVFPDPIWSPDVQLRVGRRSLGWFELGFGAYDASTTLRPGLYVGGGGGQVEALRISGHLGIHLVNGLCCSSVVPFGGIVQLDVEHAVSDSLVAGADFKAEAAAGKVFAGGLHLALLL